MGAIARSGAFAVLTARFVKHSGQTQYPTRSTPWIWLSIAYATCAEQPSMVHFLRSEPGFANAKSGDAPFDRFVAKVGEPHFCCCMGIARFRCSCWE